MVGQLEKSKVELTVSMMVVRRAVWMDKKSDPLKAAWKVHGRVGWRAEKLESKSAEKLD